VGPQPDHGASDSRTVGLPFTLPLGYAEAVRVAWFSPIPPVRSGISAYTAEILPLLASAHDIDVFVDDTVAHAARDPACPGARSVLSAHAFIPRQTVDAYHLVVYQLGNAMFHDYMWPYMLRYPGLVVLHDAAVHHARARHLLSRGRRNDYRAEFAYSHPSAPDTLAEYAIAGFDGLPYFLWPHVRLPIESARVVAVHSRPLATELANAHPDASIAHIRMGVRPVSEAARAGGPDVVFGCFGRITPEKRIPQVLHAFAATARVTPAVRLVLVGEVPDYYDVRADIARHGLEGRVELHGYVDDHQIDGALSGIDVCVCLRWPTAGETSASWLRCLAAGKPTVITDLVHTTDVPALDPRSWTLLPPSHTPAPSRDARDAVTVAIDILDENHSLALAMTRLATDDALRAALGRRALEWWATHHTLELMAEDYRSAINAASARTAPPVRESWPAHLLADGTGLTQRILTDFGIQDRVLVTDLTPQGRG
jgi:glycosyltransferase involved in cell wall biosynthesis